MKKTNLKYEVKKEIQTHKTIEELVMLSKENSMVNLTTRKLVFLSVVKFLEYFGKWRTLSARFL